MKVLKYAVLLGLAGTVVGIGLGFLGALHPSFDTFSHFRLHLGVALCLISIILLIIKRYWLLILSALVGLTGVYHSAIGTTFTANPVEADPTRPVYSLFHFNLYWINNRREDVIDHILELDPELISLSEAATRWTATIRRLDEKWPYLIHCPEWGKRGGLRLYSKWPLEKEGQYCGPYGSFAKTRVISPEGVSFTSGSVHLRWPWPASGPQQLRDITPELKTIGENALFAGDFNATTWSHTIRHFSRASGMDIIPGIGPTWMIDELPLRHAWWAGLPIDNVMAKGRIKVLSAKTLEDLGSDHLPILVRFQIN